MQMKGCFHPKKPCLMRPSSTMLRTGDRHLWGAQMEPVPLVITTKMLLGSSTCMTAASPGATSFALANPMVRHVTLHFDASLLPRWRGAEGSDRHFIGRRLRAASGAFVTT